MWSPGHLNVPPADPLIPSEHFPGWVAEDRIESCVRHLLTVPAVEHLRELHDPMEEAPLRRNRVGVEQQPPHNLVRQLAAAGEDNVRERVECRTKLRPFSRVPKPAGTPHVGDALPSGQLGVVLLESGERALFRAHLFQRVSWSQRQADADGDGGADGSIEGLALEEGKVDRTFPCPPTRWWLSEHVPGRGANQAVANAESMVQKGQGPTGSERGEPERQAAQLDGHRVDVDAVQTSLCDRSPESCPVRLRDVRARRGTLANQRRFVRRGEVATGGHEESAAAHRGIDDPQVHDPLGYGVLNERGERAADEVFGQRTRRVERSGGLAPVLSCGSRRRVFGQLEVEQPLVHATELLDAEVPVCDALATWCSWACRNRTWTGLEAAAQRESEAGLLLDLRLRADGRDGALAGVRPHDPGDGRDGAGAVETTTCRRRGAGSASTASRATSRLRRFSAVCCGASARGEGQYLDVAMLDASLVLMARRQRAPAHHRRRRSRRCSRSSTSARRSPPYRTRDGWIWLSANFQNQYEALCRVIDAPELVSDPRFADVRVTQCALGGAQSGAGDATGAAAPRSSWSRADGSGLPGGAGADHRDVLRMPLLREREHAAGNARARAGGAGDADQRRIRRRRGRSAPASGPMPALGEHTDEVLRELGYADDEIDALRAQGAV